MPFPRRSRDREETITGRGRSALRNIIGGLRDRLRGLGRRRRDNE
jgi:hypothetical protein